MDISSKIIKNKFNILAGIIFIVAAFLRFWKVPQLFFFGIDEEYQSLLAQTIVKHFHIIWIGLSAANTGYYVGPGLVYLHAALLWLSKGDPVIFGYFASTVGIVTLTVFYFTVKELFDKKTALISTILYGFSSFIVYYDRRFWNSTFVPLTAILIYYSLVKAKKNTRWLILTAFLIASAFHIHASLFVFIPIISVVLIKRLIGVKKVKIDWLTVILSAVIYFVITSPLLVYDFVHNFDNLKTPLRIISQLGKGNNRFSLSDHLLTIISTFGKFWFNTSQPFSIACLFFLISAGALVLFFMNKKYKTHGILKIILIVYLLIFILYPGNILEYYYLGFLPFLTIIIASQIVKLDKRLLVFLLAIYAFVNMLIVTQWPVSQELAAKKTFIVKTSKKIGSQSFYLTTDQDYLYFGGWRFLFDVYGNRPASSQADTMFGWIYPSEISPDKPKLKVTIREDNNLYKAEITKNE